MPEALENFAGAMSTPRWQSWPMPAWNPERGSSTPTFRRPPWARPMENGAVPARSAGGAEPPAKVRRVTFEPATRAN